MEWTQAWLSYRKKESCGNDKFAHRAVLDGFDAAHPVIANALDEWKRGVKGMLEVAPEAVEPMAHPAQDGVAEHRTQIADAAAGARQVCAARNEEARRDGDESGSGMLRIVRQNALSPEAYRVSEQEGILTLAASDESGVLYGIFALLRRIAQEEPLKGAEFEECPSNPMRMIDHWDNMDGSIERGYSGRSFFFEQNDIILNERTKDYCRLAASIGINGVVINNVNVGGAATWLITERYWDKLAEMEKLFSGYGIRLYMSINYASSIDIGGLDSADPLDPAVIEWWQDRMKKVHEKIPGLGGFLVKADSEGRPGPFTYGRTQAQGANMLADAAKPYGWKIIWRCFVYNCRQDWRDYKTDRARAAYDHFIEMDGDYHENVILQIKNGPMDFQIREPVSPLLGGMRKTNQMLEVQAAQEYTGQQIDVCYLIPLYKEVLSFKTYCAPERDTVADIIAGRCGGMAKGCSGMAAVGNTGNDANWTGNVFAAANFYGFGRLAWDTELSAEEIAREWIALTFSKDKQVTDALLYILLSSRETYEKYTCPLGIGWMVNPGGHYGPSVDGYEYSRWGTYHRADHLGLGVDRSDAGTGYAQQYREPNASMYNAVESCPENLLLFFHHVSYTYRLKTGKTLIQHIYDTHFEGVSEVEEMIRRFETIKGMIDEASYENMRERFERQKKNAEEWRDQVNTYFYRKSGIADEKGRKIY